MPGKALIKEVAVEAPASIANLGPGFDVMAAAVDGFKDTVILRVYEGEGNVDVKALGEWPVPSGEGNAAYGILEKFINAYGPHNVDLSLTVYKGVPPGYGLGSSGATSAATAYALERAFDLELNSGELVRLAGYGEAQVAGAPHYDNVSASLLGGIVLVDPEDFSVIKLIPPFSVWFALISPDVGVGDGKTRKAREILPRKVDLRKASLQASGIAKAVHAIHSGDASLLGRAVSRDLIAEPSRSKLIPHYWELKDLAMSAGALGFNIAGAGPSVFALCGSEEKAEEIASHLVSYLRSKDVGARAYVTKLSHAGAKEVRRG